MIINLKARTHMTTLQDSSGNRKIVFLSREDKDYLIYLSSDVWITPETNKFKNELLERAGLKRG